MDKVVLHDEHGAAYEFDKSCWPSILKFDDEPAYQSFKNCVAGTKAVDFVGLHSDDSGQVLYLIEVTDYSKNPSGLKEAIIQRDLAAEFAHKVQSTMCGLVVMPRLDAGDRGQWIPFLKHVADHKTAIKVVLCLGGGRGSLERIKQRNDAIKKQLKQLIRFVGSGISVVTHLRTAQLDAVGPIQPT